MAHCADSCAKYSRPTKFLNGSASSSGSECCRVEKRRDTKHVVISGASRGLGAAIAAQLLERGHTVTGFARQRTSELEDLERRHPDRILTGVLDITSTESLDSFLAKARG